MRVWQKQKVLSKPANPPKYRMTIRESSLRNSQNAIVTTGLICAPLSFPTAESAIVAPVVPNRNPVISSFGPSASGSGTSAFV
jgi:hypothetical protein